MKKVLLIGDSIRLGYEKYVKLAFDGVAEIASPANNCIFSAYHIRFMRSWLEECYPDGDTPDIIHFNAGLWDCKHMVDGLVHTDVEQYGKNLERIVTIYRKLCPDSKLIFALTTPVIDSEMRLNCEIEQYNKKAVEVMTRHGIEINDLYSVMKDVPESYFSDKTHYRTKKGMQRISDHVISVLENAIGVTAKKVDCSTDFEN